MFENLKFFWRSSSCSPYGFIRHQEIGNIWLKNAIQTNNQDLNYNIHQEKIRQFPKFDGAERQKGKKADSDFQSVFPDMILASTSDLLKWFFSFRKMLKGILVELWMSFVDISWCLCGHFAWFWLGIRLRSSFPIFCPWKSIKIQQKYLVWNIGIINCGRWTNDTLKIWKKYQYLFNIWHIIMRTKVLQLSD